MSHSAREVERLKKQGVDIKEKRPDDGFYEWKNPDTGETLKIPDGIDPGWAYNPGRTAWGQRLSRETMDAWKAQGAKAWEPLIDTDWRSYGRPKEIKADAPVASLGATVSTRDELEKVIKKVLGSDEKTFSFRSRGFRYDILVNASSLAAHVDPDRSAFLPFLPETMENPYEVWLSFERHKGTGKVVLRQRIVKAVRLDKNRGLTLVVQSRNGFMEAWTMVPTSKFGYLNRQRRGKLIWARE